jgi:hypothetical protein
MHFRRLARLGVASEVRSFSLSGEFHQVVAGYSYGIQMRRVANASEIEDHAYYIGAYGLKESGVRLLKSLEFFNKSIQIY